MRPRLHPVLTAILALCLATCLVAGAGAAGNEDAGVTESLGVHLERTEVAGLVTRPDGSFLALVGKWPRVQRVETFGADGSLDPDAPKTKAPPESRLFQAGGGKSYALGYEELTRLEPDGSPDPTFGKGGTVKPPHYGARAVYELPSGQIAVVCTEVNGTHTGYGSLSVFVLDHDGGESATKGGGVGLPGSYAPASVVPIAEISPIADGGALVVGEGFMVELEPNGSVKRGFGEAGVAATTHSVIGAEVLPNGSIDAVGVAPEEKGGSQDVGLYRFTAAGQPETAFGPEGGRRFDLSGGGIDSASVVSWGADGSALVGGDSTVGGDCSKEECEETPFVAAFNAAGDLEAGFGQGGVAELPALTADHFGYRWTAGVTTVARRPDGSIVAAGTVGTNETINFFAGLSAQGALLSGFGEGGIVRAPEEVRASQEVTGLAALKGGGLLAVGTTDVGIESGPMLVRYGADDRLDRSFGDGTGFVFLRRPEGYSHGATGFAVGAGKVLTGVYEYPRSHLVMARASDGSLVSTFGKEGTVDLPKGTRPLQEAFGKGGDPVVLAVRHHADLGEVLRYLPNGRFDRHFADGGRFALRLDGHNLQGKSMLAGSGGRVIVGADGGHRFVLVSLLANGRPDPRFGGGGWSIARLGAGAHYLTLARIGPYIYLAGMVGEEKSRANLVLMRFDRRGRLDRDFGRGGIRTVKLATRAHPTGIVATPAGPLVVMSGGRKPLITFGRGGKVSRRPVRPQPTGSRSEYASDVRATVAGNQLVVGWTTYSKANGGRVFHLDRRPLASAS